MNTILIEKLKRKVDIWKINNYEGVYPETKNILNFIQKINFLYQPQIEALETYIYLKEILGNRSTDEIVPSLYDSKKELFDSLPISQNEKLELAMDENWQDKISELVKREYGQFDYPNQVYALTMGSGKTILMGTMILYEFVLSVIHPDDSRFAKNILVFAPDTTIIESLKEIKSFDYTKVLPKEYQNIALNIKYHYLESTETSVNFLGNYNIIISNSQKIIIKTKHKQELNMSLLTNESEREKASTVNKRLQALQRLQNLSIFVDEAHHSYGTSLEGTLKKTRETINFLHEEGKTPLVNVVNLTGTPYVNNKFINDVVYHFGLKQGIEQGILKQVRFFEYQDVKSEEFIDEVISEFSDTYGEKKLEGKLPKIAFYASNIDDLQQNLRPALERILLDKGISTDKILEFHTEKEENKDEFIKLDKPESNKQYILLVGKGTEGWNVRSLVSTALYRKPSSSIFVLQSSTRCLRSIGDNSTHASIFLSEENAKILDKELKNNFGTTRAEIEQQITNKIELKLNVLKTKSITVKKELHEIEGIFNRKLEDITIPNLKEIMSEIKQAKGIKKSITLDKDSSDAILESELFDIKKQKIVLPKIHFISEISLKTHLPCFTVKEILGNNGYLEEKIEIAESRKNDFLDLISTYIINNAFKYEEKIQVVDEVIELTKNFPFKLSREKDKQSLIIYKENLPKKRLGFHINPYAFDSKDEMDLFVYLQGVLEKDEVVTDIFFTGNISDISHTDFYFEYWNPQEQRFARYFPDFLVETNKNRFIVVEVKADSERTDYQANKKQFDAGNKELFNVVFSKEVGFQDFKKVNKNFEYHIIFNAGLQQKQKELLEKLQNDFKSK